MRGAPFAVAAVEDEDGIVRATTQDVQQVVRLGAFQGKDSAFTKVAFDEKAGGGKVVCCHGSAWSPAFAGLSTPASDCE